MGEYNGVVGGVSRIVTDGFGPWWEGISGTVGVDRADEYLTTDDAFKRALDWEVKSAPVYLHVTQEDGTILPVEFEGKIGTYREDVLKPLGIVSDGFGITPNLIVKEFCDAIKAHGGDVYVKSAGGLFDDRQVWMLCKLGDDKYFDGLDENLQRYLLVATGHDGSLSLSARPTNVRVECMNTFDWAIKGTKSVVSLKHTSKVADRYEDAKRVITLAYDHFDAMDEEIKSLMATEYSRTKYQDTLVPAIVGDKPEEEGTKLTNWEKKRDGLVASYERPDQRNIAGTAWGAVMAVNSYEQWGVSVRGQSRAEMQARKAVSGTFPLTTKARELVLA